MIGIHIYYVSCLTDNYNKKKRFLPNICIKKSTKKKKTNYNIRVRVRNIKKNNKVFLGVFENIKIWVSMDAAAAAVAATTMINIRVS